MKANRTRLAPSADLWFVAHHRRYRLREILRHEGLTFYVSRTGRVICRDDITRWSPWLALTEHSVSSP